MLLALPGTLRSARREISWLFDFPKSNRDPGPQNCSFVFENGFDLINKLGAQKTLSCERIGEPGGTIREGNTSSPGRCERCKSVT